MVDALGNVETGSSAAGGAEAELPASIGDLLAASRYVSGPGTPFFLSHGAGSVSAVFECEGDEFGLVADGPEFDDEVMRLTASAQAAGRKLHFVERVSAPHVIGAVRFVQINSGVGFAV